MITIHGFKNELLVELGQDSNLQLKESGKSLLIEVDSPNSEEVGQGATYEVMVSAHFVRLKTVSWTSKLLPLISERRPIDDYRSVISSLKTINKVAEVDELSKLAQSGCKKESLILKGIQSQQRQSAQQIKPF